MREKLEPLERGYAAGDLVNGAQVPRLPRVESLEDAMLRATRDMVRRTPTTSRLLGTFYFRSAQGIFNRDLTRCRIACAGTRSRQRRARRRRHRRSIRGPTASCESAGALVHQGTTVFVA